MNSQDFTMTLRLNQTPQEVFTAINNVRGWWSENIDGPTDQLNADFLYHYKDVHTCRIRVAKLVPGKRVVWQVMDNHFSFTKDKDEWKGDEMIFDISPEGSGTQLVFTQHGLTSADECYNVCNDAWTGFIGNSLRQLIATGKGEPTPKDEDGAFNEAIIEKWGLNEQKKGAGYSYSFTASRSTEDVFAALLDVRGWWSGLYGERFEGASDKLNDEFTFHAGDGMHYSRQKLTELVPNESLAWQVTDSNLTFAQKPDEWTGTTIGFRLSKGEDNSTQVAFQHTGLVPAFECYEGCAGAWTKYPERLADRLK